MKAVTCVHTADEATALADDQRFAVPDFDLAEALVGKGVDSSRIAVVPPESAAAWETTGAFVPAQPYRFPWQCLVVLPTYDEHENLEAMVAAIGRHLDTDILVVDDNSPDGTGAVADALSEADARVSVLHRPEKRGLGVAYVAGFEWGLARGYERLLQMDCDFSHAPWDLPRLVHASANADLVIGSRYVAGGSTEGWNLARRLLSRCGNLYASLFLGAGVRDWTAGFRCFRSEILRRIELRRVQAAGYGFQIEMAWAAQRAGGSVREIGVRFVDREHGKSKMNRAIAFEAMRVVPALRLRG